MTYEKITKGVIFVSFLWILQSIGRLSFAILGGPAGMGQFLDVSISYTTSLILFVMFILLGVFGFIAAFALLTRRKWGFLSTILVSIATIFFDIWGLTIQFTAAIGFIIPIISIIILYLKRN
ncbi:MAG: hypothetical protein QXF82_06225 [Nitrososphaeria archaeon]